MTLHIITRSHSQSQGVTNCLSVIGENDALLFIEDGTYCLQSPDLMKQLKQCKAERFWLQPDLNARGIRIEATINSIDYSGFVTLTENHTSCQTWG